MHYNCSIRTAWSSHSDFTITHACHLHSEEILHIITSCPELLNCQRLYARVRACRYAAADSVQALPLVSTIWGVVLFGEYYR